MLHLSGMQADTPLERNSFLRCSKVALSTAAKIVGGSRDDFRVPHTLMPIVFSFKNEFLSLSRPVTLSGLLGRISLLGELGQEELADEDKGADISNKDRDVHAGNPRQAMKLIIQVVRALISLLPRHRRAQ